MDFRAYVRARVPPLALAREPEILDELAQHLADLYQEGRADGLSHDAALAQASAALPEYPDVLAREIQSASRALPAIIASRWAMPDDVAPRSAGVMSILDDVGRDLRYAVRMLARTPGFTAVVAFTMALGIGANTVIFSAVDAILVRSAPVADPDRVVSVYTSSEGASFSSSSYADFADVRDSGVLQGVAAFAGITVALDVSGATDAVPGEIVSGSYFDVLGVRMAMGRSFMPEEDRPETPARVVVLSHGFWQRRLGGDGDIAGRVVGINGQRYTVIGVASRDFLSPLLGRAPDLWVPLALQPEVRPPSAGVRHAIGGTRMFSIRDLRWLNIVGRLREDRTLEESQAALDVLASRLRASHPESNRALGLSLVSLGDGPGLRTATRPLLRLLGGAVAIVLLIACANVASLLLARAVSRRREIAVRVAMGAGRNRLVRQWLTEAVVLSLLGAAGAVPVALWAAPLLHGFGIPESIPLGLNLRVLAFTTVTAVACGLLFGLAPAVQALRGGTIDALRDEGGAVATGVRAARMRGAFLVLQFALSLVLLVGAGLFLRTLQNAYAVELGYQVERTLLADINLDVRGYTTEAGQALYQQILDRAEAVPGVRVAAAARVPVLSGGARTVPVSLDGRPVERDRANAMAVRANVVTDRYFDALGIPLLRGRHFSASDQPSAPPVAIVSRGLAARLWGTAEAIGRPVMVGDRPAEVIGVVADSIYVSTVERNPPPLLYFPLSQRYESGMTLHLRTASDPMSVVPAVRAAIREIDPQLVLARPRLLSSELERSLGAERMMAVLVGLFGAVALLLAVVGLYGVMAHLASQRTTEIGIRLALGARPSSILRLMVGSGLRLVGIGTILGLAGAAAGTRLLANQLFDVSPTDPATFGAVVIVLITVAVAACVVPARRATRVDPATALRHP